MKRSIRRGKEASRRVEEQRGYPLLYDLQHDRQDAAKMKRFPEKIPKKAKEKLPGYVLVHEMGDAEDEVVLDRTRASCGKKIRVRKTGGRRFVYAKKGNVEEVKSAWNASVNETTYL